MRGLFLGPLAGALLAGLFLWLGSDRALRDRAFDLATGLRGEGAEIERSVAFVSLDRRTLEILGLPVGQVPDRKIWARLIRACRKAGAGTIVVDVIFDRVGATPNESDRALVEAVAESAPVVLASRLQGDSRETTRLLLPFPELRAVATSTGLANFQASRDGVLRRVKLVGLHEGRRLDYLALAAARAELAIDDVSDEPDGLLLRKGSEILRRIPLLEDGSSWVRFLGERAIDTISAGDLLGLTGKTVHAMRIRGKTIVIGAGAEVMGDVHTTALDRYRGVGARTPGPYVLGTLIDALLGPGGFYRIPARKTYRLAYGILGAFSGLVAASMAFLWAFLLHVALAVGLVTISLSAFTSGLFVDFLDPCLLLVASFVVGQGLRSLTASPVAFPVSAPAVGAMRLAAVRKRLALGTTVPLVTDHACQHEFPYPLAQAYRRMRVAVRSKERCAALLQLVSRCLAFLGSIVWADWRRSGREDAEVEALVQALADPAPADWWRFLQRATPLLGAMEGGLSISEFARLFEKGGTARFLGEMVEAHGALLADPGMTLSPARQKAVVQDLEVKIRSVMIALGFLRDHALAWVEGMSMGDEGYHGFVRTCMGCDPAFASHLFVSGTPLAEHRLLLFARDFSWAIPMDPCWIRHRGEEDEAETMYRFERVSPATGQVRYAALAWDESLEETLDGASWRGKRLAWLLGLEGGEGEGRIELEVPEVVVADVMQSPLAFAADDLVGEKYRIIGLIKSGGMGDVYEARHTELDQARAIKVLPEELARDATLVRRFHQEARLMAGLDDPRIIRVFDNGKQDRCHYMVMEYVEGEDLSDLLKRNGVFEEERAVALAIEILRGLAHIHDSKIIHRDIKPGNVMITSSGAVKIADFGIARQEESGERMTRTNERLGTTEYMAPELLAEGLATPRSDVYAMAVTLWEILTARIPRNFENSEEGLESHTVSMELLELLFRGLSRKAEDRFPDARAFLEALETLAGDSTSFNLLEDTAESYIRRILPERYGEVSLLGEGGMGVVFRARDLQLDRWVAVKLLSPFVKEDAEAVERFHREAQAMAHLNHPSIVAIHDVMEGEIPFFIMEYVKGRPLREEIAMGKGMEPTRVLRIGQRLCEAFAYAHSKGIIHRDIKSDNVFLRDGDEVTVLDFGLAKIENAERLTRMGNAMGTVAYMSPEQFRGEAVDARSDVFSLGVLVYEMLAGHRPFLSAAMREDDEKELACPPDFPLAERVEALLQACLVQNRDERMQSMEAFGKALGSILERLEA